MSTFALYVALNAGGIVVNTLYTNPIANAVIPILAAYGPVGAQRVMEIVQGELVLAMAATGRPTLDSIDRSLVRTDFS